MGRAENALPIFCFWRVVNMEKKIVERINVSKGKSKQVSFRVDGEELLRLEVLKKTSGLETTQIMKEFINNGEVNVRYDAKKVIGKIAMIHDEFNVYSHKVRDEVSALKNVLLKIEEQLDNSESDLMIKAVLKNAEFLTEHMMREYMGRRESAEGEIKSNVDIHSGK